MIEAKQKDLALFRLRRAKSAPKRAAATVSR